jgi:hypothetical protein
MAYMFNLNDRYHSFKKDYEAYESTHNTIKAQGNLSLPIINSLGPDSKFKKERLTQYKYDRNKKSIKERKLINFQRRSIEKMYFKGQANSKVDYGMESPVKDKTSHYFNEDKDVKILRMDSVNPSKDNSFDQRAVSRNSAVKKNVTCVQNGFNCSSNIGDNSSKVFFNVNQTPTVIRRSNQSVDEKISNRGAKGRTFRFYNSKIAHRELDVNNKIVHEGLFGHDPKYISSIIQSKSLSSDLKFN